MKIGIKAESLFQTMITDIYKKSVEHVQATMRIDEEKVTSFCLQQ